jgi:hypothetical protein
MWAAAQSPAGVGRVIGKITEEEYRLRPLCVSPMLSSAGPPRGARPPQSKLPILVDMASSGNVRIEPYTISPYTISVAEEVLTDLRSRLACTRWPPRRCRSRDGTPARSWLGELVHYWLTDFDWQARRGYLALPGRHQSNLGLLGLCLGNRRREAERKLEQELRSAPSNVTFSGDWRVPPPAAAGPFARTRSSALGSDSNPSQSACPPPERAAARGGGPSHRHSSRGRTRRQA